MAGLRTLVVYAISSLMAVALVVWLLIRMDIGNYSGLATPMRRPAHSFGAGRLLAQVAMAVRQVRR